MCPLTVMYVCRYGIALYTHGCTQPSGRGSNLVYMHHIRQERTQERGLQVRPAIRKAEGGGGGGGGGGGVAVRFRPFIHPCMVYLLNGEGDLALGRGSINPPPPPSA